VAPNELLSLGAYDNPGPYWTNLGATRRRNAVRAFGWDDEAMGEGGERGEHPESHVEDVEEDGPDEMIEVRAGGRRRDRSRDRAGESRARRRRRERAAAAAAEKLREVQAGEGERNGDVVENLEHRSQRKMGVPTKLRLSLAATKIPRSLPVLSPKSDELQSPSRMRDFSAFLSADEAADDRGESDDTDAATTEGFEEQENTASATAAPTENFLAAIVDGKLPGDDRDEKSKKETDRNSSPSHSSYRSAHSLSPAPDPDPPAEDVETKEATCADEAKDATPTISIPSPTLTPTPTPVLTPTPKLTLTPISACLGQLDFKIDSKAGQGATVEQESCKEALPKEEERTLIDPPMASASSETPLSPDVPELSDADAGAEAVANTGTEVEAVANADAKTPIDDASVIEPVAEALVGAALKTFTPVEECGIKTGHELCSKAATDIESSEAGDEDMDPEPAALPKDVVLEDKKLTGADVTVPAIDGSTSDAAASDNAPIIPSPPIKPRRPPSSNGTPSSSVSTSKVTDAMEKIMHTLTNVHQYRNQDKQREQQAQRRRPTRAGGGTRGSPQRGRDTEPPRHRTAEDDIAEIVKAAALAVGQRGRRMGTRGMDGGGMEEGRRNRRSSGSSGGAGSRERKIRRQSSENGQVCGGAVKEGRTAAEAKNSGSGTIAGATAQTDEHVGKKDNTYMHDSPSLPLQQKKKSANPKKRVSTPPSVAQEEVEKNVAKVREETVMKEADEDGQNRSEDNASSLPLNLRGQTNHRSSPSLEPPSFGKKRGREPPAGVRWSGRKRGGSRSKGEAGADEANTRHKDDTTSKRETLNQVRARTRRRASSDVGLEKEEETAEDHQESKVENGRQKEVQIEATRFRKGRGINNKWGEKHDECDEHEKRRMEDSLKKKDKNQSSTGARPSSSKGGGNGTKAVRSTKHRKKRNRSVERRKLKEEQEKVVQEDVRSAEDDVENNAFPITIREKKKKVKDKDGKRGSKIRAIENVDDFDEKESPRKKKKSQDAKKKKNKTKKLKRKAEDEKIGIDCDESNGRRQKKHNEGDDNSTGGDSSGSSVPARMAYQVDGNMNIVETDTSSDESDVETLRLGKGRRLLEFSFRTPEGIDLMDHVLKKSLERASNSSFLSPGVLAQWIPHHGHWNSSAWAGTGKSVEGCIGNILSVATEDGEVVEDMEEDQEKEQNFKGTSDVIAEDKTKSEASQTIVEEYDNGHLQIQSLDVPDDTRSLGISKNLMGKARLKSCVESNDEELTLQELRKRGPPEIGKKIAVKCPGDSEYPPDWYSGTVVSVRVDREYFYPHPYTLWIKWDGGSVEEIHMPLWKFVDDDPDARIRLHFGHWVRRLRCLDACEGRLPMVRRSQRTNERCRGVEWIQCADASCGKWRSVPYFMDADSLLRRCNNSWYCVLNTWDDSIASCSAPQDTRYMECLEQIKEKDAKATAMAMDAPT